MAEPCRCKSTADCGKDKGYTLGDPWFCKKEAEAKEPERAFVLLRRLVKWPRGRYNGQRIDGFQVSFRVHLLWWRWRPVIRWNYGEPYFIWLCVSLRGEMSFYT